MALMDRRHELPVAALPAEAINGQTTLAHMLPLASKFDGAETHNDRPTPPSVRLSPADNLISSNRVAFSANQILPARTITGATGDVVMEPSQPSPAPSEHAPGADSKLDGKQNVADVDKVTTSKTLLDTPSSEPSSIESTSEHNPAGAEISKQPPSSSIPASTSGVSLEYVPMNQDPPSAPVLGSVTSISRDESANPTARNTASPSSSGAAEESLHLETVPGLAAINAVPTTSPHTYHTPQDTHDLDLGHVGISQLAIDRGSHIDSSLDSGPTKDVLMTDVPVVVKVAREREYDANDASDEPATKRARTNSAENAPHAETGSDAKSDSLTDTKADAQADTRSARQANPQANMQTDAPDTPAETPAETPDSQAEAQAAFTIDSLPRWLEPAVVSQSINDFQRKQYRHFLQLAKKTTGGASFRDSVERLWPSIWNEYQEKVPNPMDISEMDRRMRDGVYQTLGPFMMDLALIYANCALFNGADHQLTTQAQGVVETIWSRVLKADSNDTPTSKSSSRSTGATRQVEPRAAKLQKAQAQFSPHSQAQAQAQAQVQVPAPVSAHSHTQAHHQRPSRYANGQEAVPPSPTTGHSRETALPRRQSNAVAMSPTERSTEQTYAVPPGGVPQIRRASTATDASRPKRVIQPPKSKDIDYISAKNAKKNLRPELQFCEAVLSEVMDEKHVALNVAFLAPVDPVALGIPTYFNIIKKPMDLSTVSKTLLSGQYNNAKQFDTDMRLMFRNCFRFNGEADLVYKQGKSLEALYDAEYKRKSQWMTQHALPTRSTLALADSDEDISEDDEDEEPPATSRVALTESSARTDETIQALQSKLSEEMMKLTAMFAKPKPNSSLIQLQESMIEQVKQSLLSEKEKQATQKTEKMVPSKTSSAKQAAKSRPRTSGGGGRKAVPVASASSAAGSGGGGGGGGGGGAKKGVLSGGVTKKSSAVSSRRVLTSDETQYVAETMSHLDSPFLEDAIAIIKRDTGQDENLDGELELEIEILSPDAMLRLFDICQKSKAAQNPPPQTTLSRNLGPKPKKNKPMSKTEQERKIRELRHLEARFQAQGAGSPVQEDSMEGIQSPAAPPVESSDDSSSEEE